MSEQQDPEETPVRVTDKRKKAKQQKMPTAQELLDKETPPPATDGVVVEETESEFARQQREAEEDARRAAEFEAMSPEEQQALLAQQAAEAEGVPFAGGGIKTEGENKKEILGAFVIAIDLDGTSYACPWDGFVADDFVMQREVTPRMMYRSCAEVMMDIEATETSHMTLQMFKTVGDLMAQQQRSQALSQQLQKRGMRGR